MRKLFIAALLLVCSPLLFAQPDLRPAVERGHWAFRTSEKTVLLRYETATSAVGAVAETVSLDGVIDMNPVRALSGTYAVIVTGDGLSFIKPAPVMVKGASILVLVPFSATWDVQSVTVHNLPAVGSAPQTFTSEGDVLLSKSDVDVANSFPALRTHRYHARAAWCIEPSLATDDQFATSDGGHVCFTCIACSDGSWEICSNPYSC
ncbi:MAG TPA: hypothetical protein VH087_03815 [Thermoanaerobaculia bacterium]|jgi:hypothetical protein|nr:hypothetical protein [Thermoanaerobaculia bacterium]